MCYYLDLNETYLYPNARLAASTSWDANVFCTNQDLSICVLKSTPRHLYLSFYERYIFAYHIKMILYGGKFSYFGINFLICNKIKHQSVTNYKYYPIWEESNWSGLLAEWRETHVVLKVFIPITIAKYITVHKTTESHFFHLPLNLQQSFKRAQLYFELLFSHYSPSCRCQLAI